MLSYPPCARVSVHTADVAISYRSRQSHSIKIFIIIAIQWEFVTATVGILTRSRMVREHYCINIMYVEARSKMYICLQLNVERAYGLVVYLFFNNFILGKKKLKIHLYYIWFHSFVRHFTPILIMKLRVNRYLKMHIITSNAVAGGKRKYYFSMN